MNSKIITRMLEDELYESTDEHQHLARIDMRKGDAKTGLSPTQQLLAALAACGAVDIVGMLKKRRKNIQSFIIETNGTRRDEAPKYFTKIHCKYSITSPDVTEDELTKAAALALEKYCSVASSLKSEITFSVEVIRN
ncbi:MAG TPA: OsmC family protein [Cyclobacteriaceae bacterium]|nr:OsmC family protein [Cyclobacteriaceae bacterium]